MKLKLSLLTILFLAGLFLLSCTKQPNPKVELKLNIPKGYSAIVRVTTDVNSLYTFQEKEYKGYKYSVDEYLIECLNVEPNGTMTIKQTLKAIKVDNKNDRGINYKYDSNNPPAEDPPNIAMLIAGLEKSLIIKVTPDVKVIDVQGVEAIVESQMNASKLSDAIDMEANRKQMTQMHKQFTKVFAALTEYPKNPVFIGQKWKTEQDMSMETLATQVSGLITHNWQLKNINNGLIQLKDDFAGESIVINDMSSIWKDAEHEMPSDKTKVEMSGSSDYKVDSATGLIKYAKTVTQSETFLENNEGDMLMNSIQEIETIPQ